MMKYIKKGITKEWLLNNNFRYNRFFSTKEDSVYSQRFVVLMTEYGKRKPSLECEILCYYPDGIICINVYIAGTREKYHPFYDYKHNKHNEALKSINKKINDKVKQLGLKKYE